MGREKKHVSKNCEKGYATPEDLRTHMNTHMGSSNSTTNNNQVDAIAGINISTSQKPQTESNYLSAEDDLECEVCERNCGKGFFTTHRPDHTAKSAAGSPEEKL